MMLVTRVIVLVILCSLPIFVILARILPQHVKEGLLQKLDTHITVLIVLVAGILLAFILLAILPW